MINLTCNTCGERIKFTKVLPWDGVTRIYRTTCISSGYTCPSSSIYKDLPKSINNKQIGRFIINLNNKSIAKAKEKL
jgi:hypothetical protein